jgi:hypothetical protein
MLRPKMSSKTRGASTTGSVSRPLSGRTCADGDDLTYLWRCSDLSNERAFFRVEVGEKESHQYVLFGPPEVDTDAGDAWSGRLTSTLPTGPFRLRVTVAGCRWALRAIADGTTLLRYVERHAIPHPGRQAIPHPVSCVSSTPSDLPSQALDPAPAAASAGSSCPLLVVGDGDGQHSELAPSGPVAAGVEATPVLSGLYCTSDSRMGIRAGLDTPVCCSAYRRRYSHEVVLLRTSPTPRRGGT